MSAPIEREDRIIRRWLAEVSTAALGFERRWTDTALKRVDADVARRLREQRDLFDKACAIGTTEEVEQHGAAMCRGYAYAVKMLEAAAEPDDAYMLGQDPISGFRIAIGHQRAAGDRVSEQFGQSVMWITPDEIAAVLSGLEGFKAIAAIKRMMPGAELIDLRPGDPAKSDSGLAA